MGAMREGSTKPMDQVEIGYLAGIIDGEGWFDYVGSGSQNYIRIGVESIDLDLLEQCQKFSGMGVISGPRTRAEDRKPIWTWRVSRQRDAYRLLLAVSPLLSIRSREKLLKKLNKVR